MRFFRKPSLLSKSTALEKHADAADQLRADIAALEKDMAESMKTLQDLAARAAAAEARAFAAVQAGDDRTARAAVLEWQEHGDKAAAIAADLELLRAILDECHQFVSQLDGHSPPRP